MAARDSQVKEMTAVDRWRPAIIDEDIAKALGHSFRQQILWILNDRVASPSEIAKELGVSLNKVCHHVEVLKNARCINLEFERTVGNRVQHFYKATARAFLDDAEWPNVPESVKDGLRATLLQNVINDAVESVTEGTYDACERSHMSWNPMLVDEQGRAELAQILEKALLDTIAVQEEARVRLESGGAIGTPYTVSILGYPSAGGRVGRPADPKELGTPAVSPRKTKA
jgi:DNA-binding transcriptional ArsR family regulator